MGYDRIDLRKGRVKFGFEWDSWMEGQVIDPKLVIDELAQSLGLPAKTRIARRLDSSRDGGQYLTSDNPGRCLAAPSSTPDAMSLSY